MSSDSMTIEQKDTNVVVDKTVLPTTDLDKKVDKKKNGNGSPRPISFSEYAVGEEFDTQKKQFNEHVRMISFLMRDYGHTQFEVRAFEHNLPQFNNATEKTKQSIINQLAESRNQWAIANFEIYTDKLFYEISPEQPERIHRLKEEFRQDETTTERKAQISEEVRAELQTVVHWKTMFYTDMLKTVMIDTGKPTEKAEETALLKAEEITARANSMLEKVSTFKSLRKEALTHLIEHLPVSIEVWEELFPGQGQIEEDRILGERSETRMKNAKDLYKRITAEMEKKHADYRMRAEAHFKNEGENNGNSITAGAALKKAVASLSTLQAKTRLEQIKIMKTPGKFI